MTSVFARTLRRAVQCTLPLWICTAAPLLGDVTVRYQCNLKMADFLPPQAKEQAEKSMKAGAGDKTLRFKDGKSWSTVGGWTMILDYPAQQMILIDPQHKVFCKLPVAEFTATVMAQLPQFGKMPKVPNASEEQQKMMADMMAKMLANLKTTFDSKKTGRTELIQGIQADEREMTLTIEMPLPMGGPDAVMHMKMVSQMWMARPEEALKNQAIRELAGYNLYANYFMNPAAMVQKFTSGMPGSADAFKSMTEELSKTKALVLRSHVSMYMPLPPAAIKKMAEQNPGGGPINPDAPMFEMTQEAVEVSSAPVDAALFQIPADYKTSAADEMVKGLFQSQMEAVMGGPAK